MPQLLPPRRLRVNLTGIRCNSYFIEVRLTNVKCCALGNSTGAADHDSGEAPRPGVAEQALDAGAEIIMIESEGITENVKTRRTDVVASAINRLGLGKVMFEGADPPVFESYVKNYGNEVNLFVDHSQIVQLEALRAGIWGTKSTWGRVQNLPAR
jgi:hypothetical protein